LAVAITVNRGFPISAPGLAAESRFFPRRVDDCCEERRFFPRRVFEDAGTFACEERSKTVFFDEERRDFCGEERFPRKVFLPRKRRGLCCEDRRFFPPDGSFSMRSAGTFAAEERPVFPQTGLGSAGDLTLARAPPAGIPVAITTRIRELTHTQATT